MDPGYADGWVNVGARADAGRQHDGGRGRCCARRSQIDPKLAKTHFFLGDRAQEPTAATTRRSTHLRTARRSIRAIASSSISSARVLFLQAAVHARRSTSSSAVLTIDPGGSAGALQPDAVLPGPRRRGESAERERSALHALQGRRVVAGDHRAVPAAASRRQQRAPADPRARDGGAGGVASRRLAPRWRGT